MQKKIYRGESPIFMKRKVDYMRENDNNEG